MEDCDSASTSSRDLVLALAILPVSIQLDDPTKNRSAWMIWQF